MPFVILRVWVCVWLAFGLGLAFPRASGMVSQREKAKKEFLLTIKISAIF